ncbi:MAG: transporter [Verrucomicrobia bacterium]|nr:transporter [Verrucomicrobiota bacterium]MBU1734272.1 transporter [Verrucomicrobiota bacterium]MBU1855849.1 transporter [Verrucomicrobiota bacterium]
MSERKIVGGLVTAVVLTASGAFAARPLIIDDADPLDFKKFKAEGGAYYEKDSGCKHWDFPFGVAAGVFPSLELGAGFGGQFEERTEIDEKSGDECTNSENGIGDLTLVAKWQFLGETTWLPRQAIVPAVKFPTSDKDKGLGSGKTNYDLTWIASKSLCEKMNAHINVGYSWISAPADEDVGNILHYGLALDYRIVDALQWVGEVFAEKELFSGAATAIMFNTGLRFSPTEGLTFDIAAGSRLAGDAPDLIATAGLTWEFGFAKEENK